MNNWVECNREFVGRFLLCLFSAFAAVVGVAAVDSTTIIVAVVVANIVAEVVEVNVITAVLTLKLSFRLH